MSEEAASRVLDMLEFIEEVGWYAVEQGFSKCGKVSLPSENIRTATPPLPIIIAIITIVVVYPVECPYLLA